MNSYDWKMTPLIGFQHFSGVGTCLKATNERGRDVVERACGEIDRSDSAFLPNFEPVEAVVVGVDFPIPLTIQIDEPDSPPQSSGANFQALWAQQETKIT